MTAAADGALAEGALRWADVVRVLTLQNYNDRVVLLGTACLGLAAGMIGTFLLLRKRALLGDALSHATLPGIGIAFLIGAGAGASGKSLPLLLAGAVASGLLGVGAILLIRHFSRLKEDAALGIVLSVFFGVGIVIRGFIQSDGRSSAAGLDTFIYGRTASMVEADARLIAQVALAVAAGCALLFKELRLLCFDAAFAASQGWPVRALDLLLMGSVTAVTVVGLQAVGLILIIALLIIPPAAARFWTERLWLMLAIAAAIGAASGLVGAAASALVEHLPAGAAIVLAAAGAFALSMLFGPARGLAARAARRRRLNRRVAEQHLLRTMYELTEGAGEDAPREVEAEALLRARSWTARGLRRMLRRAERRGLAVELPGRRVRLTELGASEAARVTRNHRLWELYLITHAEVAPSHVDRDADAIEHVLGRGMVEKLEAILAREPGRAAVAVPGSPHPTGGGTATAGGPAVR